VWKEEATFMRTLPALIALGLLLSGTTAYAQSASPSERKSVTATDPRTGCRFVPFGNVAITTSGTPHWDGQCVNGRAQGAGKLVWLVDGKPRLRYEAEFQQGVVQGRLRGAEEVRDGDYEGEMVLVEDTTGLASVPDGRGTQTIKEVGRYEGEFRRGLRHGRGVLQYANGDRYEGGFEAGLPSGTGIFVYAHGGRYEGAVRQGRPHGVGTYVAPGILYQGEWANGCLFQNRRVAAIGTTLKECGFR
jgi:hypothetical protein